MRKFETMKFAHWLVLLVGIAATLLVWEAGRREARKAAELAPFIAAAMKRKRWMKPLEDHEIPVVRAKYRNDAALLGAARDAFRLAGVPTTPTSEELP